ESIQRPACVLFHRSLLCRQVEPDQPSARPDHPALVPCPDDSNTGSVQIGESGEIKAFIEQYKYIPSENYAPLRDLNPQDLDITSIEMDLRHPVFRDRTVLQDTPRVDSSTRGHEESASRFLLNSDYIFFTVEYNHVESEHNLKLLKV